MTKLLDHAMAVASALPPEKQDDVARKVLAALKAGRLHTSPPQPKPSDGTAGPA